MRLLSVCFILLSAASLQAQPINSFQLDDLTTSPGTVRDFVFDTSGAWAGFNTGPAAIGGYRVVGNYMTAAPTDPSPSSTDVSSGVFSINNNAVIRSVGQLIWQGSDAVPSTNAIIAHPVAFNLGNLNLNTLLSSSNFNFQWSVLSADNRNWEYTVRAYTDNASNYYEAAISSNQSNVLLWLEKSSFVQVGSPDWTNIDAISFSAAYNDGPLGGDLALANLQVAVPEVSAWLMLAVTAVVVVSYYFVTKRRRGIA